MARDPSRPRFRADFYATQDEQDLIARHAAEAGMTLSEFTRTALLQLAEIRKQQERGMHMVFVDADGWAAPGIRMKLEKVESNG